MKSFWNEGDRKTIIDRLRTMNPDQPPLWGMMTASQIVCHLSDQLLLAYGEIAGDVVMGPFKLWPINELVIRVLPWPKGAPSPKESWSTPPQGWDEDIGKLEDLINAWGNKKRDGQWPHHPLFGDLNGASWAILSYRHCDHHLRQFGV